VEDVHNLVSIDGPVELEIKFSGAAEELLEWIVTKLNSKFPTPGPAVTSGAKLGKPQEQP